MAGKAVGAAERTGAGDRWETPARFFAKSRESGPDPQFYGSNRGVLDPSLATLPKDLEKGLDTTGLACAGGGGVFSSLPPPPAPVPIL